MLKIINKSSNPLPKYHSEEAAGFDICSNELILMAPNSRRVVGTGLYFEIPVGYEAQIRPRSGLAANHGITVLNSPGTIDSDYRGEIKVILYNTGAYYKIKPGDRIAQVVMAPVAYMQIREVKEISETERGSGGLGSTGVAVC